MKVSEEKEDQHETVACGERTALGQAGVNRRIDRKDQVSKPICWKDCTNRSYQRRRNPATIDLVEVISSSNATPLASCNSRPVRACWRRPFPQQPLRDRAVAMRQRKLVVILQGFTTCKGLVVIVAPVIRFALWIHHPPLSNHDLKLHTFIRTETRIVRSTWCFSKSYQDIRKWFHLQALESDFLTSKDIRRMETLGPLHTRHGRKDRSFVSSTKQEAFLFLKVAKIVLKRLPSARPASKRFWQRGVHVKRFKLQEST